jgi:hypothetical protein
MPLHMAISPRNPVDPFLFGICGANQVVQGEGKGVWIISFVEEPELAVEGFLAFVEQGMARDVLPVGLQDVAFGGVVQVDVKLSNDLPL